MMIALQDVYNSLSTAGFSQRQVEGAMSATVAMGGDLHDALDWLCLNTPNGAQHLSQVDFLQNTEHYWWLWQSG